MIKTLAQLEFKVGEWVGHFHLLHNTPIDVAEQMFLQGLKFIEKFKKEAEALSNKVAEKPVETEMALDESGMPPEQPKSE